MSHDNHDDEEYHGPATLCVGEREVEAQVHLRGHFEPIDGRFHWYGRVAADPAVTELAGKGNQQVVVRTPEGEAEGVLGEPDPWGRYRLAGGGRPPHPAIMALPDELPTA